MTQRFSNTDGTWLALAAAAGLAAASSKRGSRAKLMATPEGMPKNLVNEVILRSDSRNKIPKQDDWISLASVEFVVQEGLGETEIQTQWDLQEALTPIVLALESTRGRLDFLSWSSQKGQWVLSDVRIVHEAVYAKTRNLSGKAKPAIVPNRGDFVMDRIVLAAAYLDLDGFDLRVDDAGEYVGETDLWTDLEFQDLLWSSVEHTRMVPEHEPYWFLDRLTDGTWTGGRLFEIEHVFFHVTVTPLDGSPQQTNRFSPH